MKKSAHSSATRNALLFPSNNHGWYDFSEEKTILLSQRNNVTSFFFVKRKKKKTIRSVDVVDRIGQYDPSCESFDDTVLRNKNKFQKV